MYDLEYTEQQIAVEAEKEAEFLDERLFWFRSSGRMAWKDVSGLPQAIRWFFSPYNWWQAIEDLRTSLAENPLHWIFGLLVPLTALGLRMRAHRELSRLASKVYSVKTDNFLLTLRALAITFRVVFGWPLLLLLVKISLS